jgi:adenylate cyclase class IV
VELALPSVGTGQDLLRLAGFTEKSRLTLTRDYYLVGVVSVEIIFSEQFSPYLEVEGGHDDVISVCGMLGIPDSDLSVGGRPYVRPPGP